MIPEDRDPLDGADDDSRSAWFCQRPVTAYNVRLARVRGVLPRLL
jgi:hypothetical protein